MLVGGCVRAILGGLAFFAESVRPVLTAGIAEGVAPAGATAEGLASAVIDYLDGSGKPLGERAASPGPIRRKEVNRLFGYVRQVMKDPLIDLQSKTLDEPFIQQAEQLIQQAALEKWGKEKYAQKVQALADKLGATNYKGSYGETWYRTVVINGPFNQAMKLAYQQEPTKRLFPFLAYRTILPGSLPTRETGVREEHRPLDGFVAPVDWDGWDRYTPPLGWNCRCRLVPVSYVIARELGWLGRQFPRGEAEFLGPRLVNGKVVVPGASPGYTPSLL